MDRETADDIKRHFEVVAEGLRTEISGLRSEIRAVDEKADTRFAETDRRFDAMDRRFDAMDRRFDAMDRRFDSRFDELGRHFDVVGESLRSDIRLVAEGVVGLDEKFTQEFVSVREEIGEVKTFLRLSYADLARRDRKPS